MLKINRLYKYLYNRMMALKITRKNIENKLFANSLKKFMYLFNPIYLTLEY